MTATVPTNAACSVKASFDIRDDQAVPGAQSFSVLLGRALSQSSPPRRVEADNIDGGIALIPADEPSDATAVAFAELRLFDSSPTPLCQYPTASPSLAPVAGAEQRPALRVPIRQHPAEASPALDIAARSNQTRTETKSPHARALAGARAPAGARVVAADMTAPQRVSDLASAPPIRTGNCLATQLRTQCNPVLVALHATENEFSVFARAGRMSPTERLRLRNAIGALLAEFGHFAVAVRFEEATEGMQWQR